MKILAIETSCDETGVAIVKASGDLNNPKFEVLSKAINSQIEKHKEYGGVYPTLAKREHARNIVPVLEEVLNDYCHCETVSKSTLTDKEETLKQVQGDRLKEIENILEREPELFDKTVKFLESFDRPDVDMIAVTSGPGLSPALWVGINFAKAISLAWQIPMLSVNHMEGHMASVLLRQDGNSKIQFPTLSLLISGGHTELVEIKNWNEYKILGKTRDDAVGESYDKIARLLGIPYPGGPEISRLAIDFRKKNLENEFKFPRPMIESNDLDFSFSGLKTAVLYKIQDLGNKIQGEKIKIKIAGEFEQAVVDVLMQKVANALNTNDFKSIIVAGGVVANQYIRQNISNLAKDYGLDVHFPNLEDSTDNAQMIAVAGYLKTLREKPEINPEIEADSNLTYKE